MAPLLNYKGVSYNNVAPVFSIFGDTNHSFVRDPKLDVCPTKVTKKKKRKKNKTKLDRDEQ